MRMQSINALQKAVYGIQLVTASLSGYLLTRLVAFLFGTSESAAIFEIAWSIPMFLVTASGLNVIQAVAARFFAKLGTAEPKIVSEYVSSFISIFALLIFPLLLGTSMFSESVANWAAPGLSEEDRQQVAWLIRLLSPVSAFIGFGIFLGGVYAAYGRAIAGETSLSVMRLFAVGVSVILVWLGAEISVQQLAITLLLGSLIAFFVTLILARRVLSLRISFSLIHTQEILTSVGLQACLFLLGSLLGQFAVILYRSRLSEIDTGFVASFSYAVLVTYTFSNIVGKLGFFVSARDDQLLFENRQFRDYAISIGTATVTYFLLSSAVALVLYLMAPDVIAILLEGGEFGADASMLVHQFFGVLSLSIPATTLLWILKLPAITGPRKLALPITDAIVWMVVIAYVLLANGGCDADKMILILVSSYWARAGFSAIITVFQILAASGSQQGENVRR